MKNHSLTYSLCQIVELGASMVKWIEKVLLYTKTIIFLVHGHKSSSKGLFKLDFFFMMTFVVVLNTQLWKSSWDLQCLSLKVMLKSKWLSMLLDVDFMTLTISKLEFSFIFLVFIVYLRASLWNFVENHQFYVILSYYKQILDNHLFNIPYMHTTCTVF